MSGKLHSDWKSLSRQIPPGIAHMRTHLYPRQAKSMLNSPLLQDRRKEGGSRKFEWKRSSSFSSSFPILSDFYMSSALSLSVGRGRIFRRLTLEERPIEFSTYCVAEKRRREKEGRGNHGLVPTTPAARTHMCTTRTHRPSCDVALWLSSA